MPEVLAALPAESASLRWRILDLGDLVATEESGLNVLELEKRVFSWPTGLPLCSVSCVSSREAPGRSSTAYSWQPIQALRLPNELTPT